MIKDNQRVFNRIMVFFDAFIMVPALVLAYWVKFSIFTPAPDVGTLPLDVYFRYFWVLVPGYILIFYLCGLYSTRRSARQGAEIGTVIKANLIGFGVLIVAIFLVFRQFYFSRTVLFLFCFFSICMMSAVRILLRSFLRAIRKRGYNLRHILLVGYSRATEEFIDRIKDNLEWGYNIYGIVDDHIPVGTEYRNTKIIGTIKDLQHIIEENDLDEIAIALSLKDYDYLESIVGICEKSGVHTKFIPDYNSVIPTKPYTEDLQGLPVINIRYVPLTNSGNWFVKRVMDIVGALFGILITSPIMLVVAVLVKLTSDGPVIFKQERVGLHNKNFYMYKFRSMRLQTDTEERQGWTVKDDPRVTGIGRFIRKTSIDELPQLFNILKGDMSLVGPRPERPQFVEEFKEKIPRYMVKHQVRPGLTGWAQVNGLRGNTSIKKRIEYDIYYIENWTLGFDISIIIRTFFTGFVNKNAY